MFFIVLFVCTWTWFFLHADRSRMRELYGVMVYTSFLALLTDLIMVHYRLWSYRGLPQSKFSIPLLLDFSVYPVVAYHFIQNISPGWFFILKRTIIWSGFSIVLEWITHTTGHIHHYEWWNLWFSFVADILIYLSTFGIYRAYKPAFKK